MKRATKKVIAALLALAMVCTTFLSYLPATEVKAADNERKWITITGGANNGGGHNYGNAGTSAPILILDNDKTTELGYELSLTVKPSANWGVFYNYTDDNNWIYVGYDPTSKWYYQYKINGEESYPQISGLPDPTEGEEMQLTIAISRETMNVTVNGTPASVTNQKFFDLADGGHFGVKTNGRTTISFADVKRTGVDCMNDTWGFCAERDGQVVEYTTDTTRPLTGTVKAADGTPISGATVRVGANSATTDAQGSYSFEALALKEYTMSVSKAGYEPYSGTVTVEEKDNNVFDVTLTLKADLDLTKYDTIQSDEMKVYIGKNFPVVARYEMATEGKEFFRGNESELKTVAINGVSIEPEVTVEETTEASRTYVMHVEDSAHEINVDLTVKVSVEANTLTWEVTEIKKADGCAKLATIDIPQLNLLSVSSADEGANFAGANISTATTNVADTYISFDDGFVPSNSDGYVYAFLQNGKLSAGLFSNSEAESDKRVIRNNGADTMSLTSAAWYYECGDRNGQTNAANYEDYPVSELPIAKVAIGADENGDGEIDWNDGAVAYRDIMHVADGAEDMKDIVNYRIVMNFASMAPNPFLATGDSIKKVYLATDGLPQAVMLKGYGNEGHDSANSEYADIAEREGGVEDFQKLLKIAHQYDTQVGIHVNAQEAYPEAASFNEDMMEAGFGGGWGWLDQSVLIDKLWDLSTQARWKRFVQLYDRINETSHYSNAWPTAVGKSTGTVDASKEEIKAEAETMEDNMDFIYLDVWYRDTWETRRIAEEVNSLGWRFSTEFPNISEYDMTWYHWGTDTNYGGSTMKGHNSEIMRFITNDLRDTHVQNYPGFGGTANNPLLGGFKLVGFEGWQGNQDFNSYLETTFTENLPTKFLQHYYVVDWEDYGEEETSPVSNQEKQITLKNDEGDVVVVTRNEEQRSDIVTERTITLNGKVVLNDAAYLLPWTDTEDNSEKLYHWNLDGGETTWELEGDWANLANVVMYRLTDQGRTEETTVPVTNGTVTLDADAAQAYVLVKGASAKELKAGYGEYDYVSDPGFNGYVDGEALSADDWSGDIDDASVYVETSDLGDQKLAFDSPEKDVEVKTTISGLKAGTDYVAEVYVENQSDAKAAITVDTVGKKKLPDIAELPYKDVPEDQWYYKYVYDVYAKQLMTGLDKETFGPGQNLARAQFALILYRMEGTPKVEYTNKFSDVAEGVWYTDAILWAAENGIVTGYTSGANKGKFGPADMINREQLATMMYRYDTYKHGKAPSESKDLSAFPDAGNVNEFAKDAMKWCVAKEIITGDNGKLKPQDTTIRAVCATIISRYTDEAEEPAEHNTVSNYTKRSILANYVQCDQEHGTMMQRMQVSFTAEGETAQLILSREAGEGVTYMDDIRIVEISLNNEQEDGSFVQDFETVVQGLYPFVLGSAQGVSDPVTHLSQLHDPYTQAGWNGRVVDDVLDGEWSLKHHGANTGIIYQTIPQNFRFEEGKVYTVEFDYQSGPDKAYAMVTGDGKNYIVPSEEDYLEQARGETKHVTMQVVGSGSGQTWIGLYERGNRAGSGSWGQTDFILDNLVIKEDKDAIAVTVSAKELLKHESADIYGSNLDQFTWESSDETVVKVDKENNKIVAVGAGTATVTATAGDKTFEFVMTVTDTIIKDIPADKLGTFTSTANTEELTGEPEGSGVASAAADGNSSTYWHSNWSTTGFVVSETNPAVLTVDLGQVTEMGGFKFQQRPTGGNNGMIQKYSYRVLDAEGNVLASGNNIEVASASQSSSEWVVQVLDETVNAKTIEISVLQGYNNFAAVAEVMPVGVEKID